jgi:hypothetical protein
VFTGVFEEMTRDQLKLIHIAAHQVGLIVGKDDARYRLLLKNAAGVESAKDLSNAQFEDVMAVLEDLGFSKERGWAMDRSSFSASGGSASRVQSSYWRDKVAARGSQANARMVWKIRDLLKTEHRYEARALCRRMSQGRTDEVDKLTPREAWNLIEMLKEVEQREARRGARDSAQLPTAGVTEDQNAPLLPF